MTKKVSTVALAAVLLFCSVVPVPTGAAMFDRARVNQAYANPVAGTAAEMALLALQAACIAGGIYIAGTTINEFNVNSQEIYDAFSDYYTTQNNISASELEAILAGSYTNGNIDLSALTAAGITGAIPGFAQVLMNGGYAVGGADSNGALVSRMGVNGVDYPLYSGSMSHYEDVMQYNANESRFTYLAGYMQFKQQGYNYTFVRYFFTDPPSDGVVPLRVASNASFGAELRLSNVKTVYFDLRDDGSIGAISSRTGSYESFYGVNTVNGYPSNSSVHNMLLSSCAYAVSGYNNVVSTGVAQGVLATVADGVTAGTFARMNEGIVQAFNPTAEQLQMGYDASILQGVEQAVADLGTISTGIAALDATMNGLLGVCQGIASTLSNTVVGQYCAAVTQWLGATPFGTVMGTVIDGLDAIPDSVADGAAVVAGGVAALPGALEGVIEGVLEGVFGQPLAIPGFLQDILAGVQAIPGALEGAIEGITFPEWRWPEAPEIPRVDGEPVPFALSADLIADMQTDLRDKVPFCYLIRIGESLGTLFGNLQTSRSFYFDMDVPVAGSVHFDGESFLNQPLLGSNIADVIRICATALLCTGLLYGAYKVAREL